MIAALIISGYVLIGGGVGIVWAYRYVLNDRLDQTLTEWEDVAAGGFVIGAAWPLVGIGWCVYQILRLLRRGIDAAVEAEVEERNARDRDAAP